MTCVATSSNDQELQAVVDMIIIAFFFLLWPVEYTGTKSDSSPFSLLDVTFSVGRTVFDTATTTATNTATNNELVAATFVILVFTTQKNGAQGEKIVHGATRDPLLSPKEALSRRVAHL